MNVSLNVIELRRTNKPRKRAKRERPRYPQHKTFRNLSPFLVRFRQALRKIMLTTLSAFLILNYTNI